jgi:membrane-bound lytic murein transglycosylase B
MKTLSRSPVVARFSEVSLSAVVLVGVSILAGCASAPPGAPKTVAATSTSVRNAPTNAPSTPSLSDAAFFDWVAQFRVRARAAGIDEATLRRAFDDVHMIYRVVAADQSQPEFTRAVWDYLDSAVSVQRVTQGQDKWQALRPVIDSVAARYGVPAEILVAIWGIESNFGRNMGDIPTIDALATLGFEGRREAWASSQLLAALKILQNNDIDRAHMLGSWAGAMGQTQFLPSVYLAYAVDADGDGRRDIWGSEADVMASTANFLVNSGWQANQPWGWEVVLPPGFDYALADAKLRQTNAAWGSLGVQTADHAALPPGADSSLLLPAGARGPAFLVGPNFRVILRYNNATSYALAVSLLAQRIAGGPTVQAAWPRDLQGLTRSQLRELQTALNARGFDCGTPDGVMGPATQQGLRRYQSSVGLPADGYPTLEHLQAVLGKT